LLLLFAATLFVSAFLLFLVQPMIGKMVLPSLGGTPQVWATCMVFYQADLLLGYTYAHVVSTRLPVRRQLLLQCALLFLVFLFMPFTLGDWQPPTESTPVFAVLGLLSLMVGIPFLVVATSAPLLQRWFVYTGHPAGKDPYFLYGASNLGSMLALLLYPIVVEPLFGLQAASFDLATQTWLWAAVFGLLIVLMLVCAATVWMAPPAVALAGVGNASPLPAEPGPAPAPEPVPTAIQAPRRSWKGRRSAPAAVVAPAAKPAAPTEVTALRRLRWIGLAFVPSSLMLGVTTYLTTDIAAIPLLLIIPLALYLLTFILVFMRWPVEWTGWPHRVVLVLQPFSLIFVVLINLVDVSVPQWLAFSANLLAFFLTALFCHGELARDRPSTRHLTEYYLCMSIGGVLGGLLNAIIAPLLFNRHIEYALVLALSCLLRPPISVLGALLGRKSDRPAEPTLEDRVLDYGYGLCVGLLTYALLRIAVAQNLWGEKGAFYPDESGTLHQSIAAFLKDIGLDSGASRAGRRTLWVLAAWINVLIVSGIPLIVCLVFSGRSLRFGMCALTFWLANAVHGLATDESLYVHRNFFGVIRVRTDTVNGQLQHTLIHGGIDHGRQYVEGDKRYEPITYFHPEGPIGQIFTAFKRRREANPYAVVGLGIGTLASYGRTGQVVHFYEIDPAVKRLSLPPQGEKAYFFYLQDALDKGVKLDVILGDGRLKIKEAAPKQYDIIVLDAFSSDAIPVHLLTSEAVALYKTKLAEGGVLIFNITNRYVDLKRPLANVAAENGMDCYYGGDWPSGNPDRFAADWVVMLKPRSRSAKTAEARSLAARLFLGAGARGLGAVPWAPMVEATQFEITPWLRILDLPENWEALPPNKDRLWTDDYSNLLSVLSL
jgi:hypothetical protein